MNRPFLERFAVLTALMLSLLPVLGLAQDSEETEARDAVTLVASGLNNPRGFTWNADGELIVATAGAGGSNQMTSDSQEPVMAGDTAGAMLISDGCPVQISHGLPSTRGMSGHEQGPAAVAILDNVLYVLQDSAGPTSFNKDGFPNGVYAVEKDGSVRLVADISTWINENPTTFVPRDKTDLGEPFAMLAGKGELWVLESNSGQVLAITPDGKITRVADLSENHPVPTGFTLAPDGGVYVGFLTPAPYTDGSSRVVKVTAAGEVTEVWTGLTTVTGLAVGPDGTLYAAEMSTGNTDSPPFTRAGSGRVVKQTGPSSLEEVAVGIDYPIAMAFGPDGGLYIGFPAFGPDVVTGGIIRLDLDAITSPPVQVPANILDETRCADSVLATPGAMAAATPDSSMDTSGASDGDTPAATPPPAGNATPAPTAELSEKTLTGAVAVEIKNFTFIPADIKIPAGTTVTWTNHDVVAHTATASDPKGVFDSGNLNPGQSFSFKFDTPGTYHYICTYHPFMKGTITVE